jgi:hypothetical protein
MKYVILENLSTTTKIQSLPFFGLGKPNIKSKYISTQGFLGTSKRVYKPCDKTIDLACLQVMHL